MTSPSPAEPVVAADVVAVVPTLGGDLPRLRVCLDAIRAIRDEGDLAIVVVWNHPRRVVPDLGEDVVVLAPGCNLGYGGSVLHARRRTRSRRLWMLQDDVVVRPGCLDALQRRLDEDPAAAVAAPMVLDDEGFVPAHARGGVLAPDGSMDHWFPFERVRPEDLDLDHHLDYVASAGTLLRVDAYDEIGGSDPSFFPVAWGDVDLCRRLLDAGHRLAMVPEASIGHVSNGSTPSVLSSFLGPAHQDLFRAKHVDGRIEPVEVDVDRDIVDAVVAAATIELLDFSSFVQREWIGVTTELHRTIVELDRLRAEIERLSTELAATAHEFEHAVAQRDAARSVIARMESHPARRLVARVRRLVGR